MKEVSKKRFVVTGAAGALGSGIVEKIIDNQGSVIAIDLSRRESRDCVEWLNGDIRTLEWSEIIRNCDAVVHAAAFVHRSATTTSDISECQSINTTATIQIAKECTRLGVPLVFISTVAVYGSLPEDSQINEGFPCCPNTPYGKSKREAEEALFRLRTEGLRFEILRFPLLYGPTGHGNLEKLLRAINKHRYWPIRSNAKKSLIFLPDAAQSVLNVLATNRWTGHSYNVAPQTAPTLNEIQSLAYSTLGLRKPPSLPPNALKIGTRVIDGVARLFARQTHFNSALKSLLKPVWIDGEKFRDTFGSWQPTPLEQGLLITARALR